MIYTPHFPKSILAVSMQFLLLSHFAGAEELVLPAVEVKAEAQAETATGPVKGYVAKRSSTATKTDTSILETPQSISVQGKDILALQKVGSVAEALRYTAGTSVEKYGADFRGVEWIKARGFDLWHQYRDGLRQYNYDFTEPYAMERIEFLKGPSSVLYGLSSIGGVINSVSKVASKDQINEVNLQVGSGQHKQVSFDVGGGVSENGPIAYRVIGVFRDSDTDLCYGYNSKECLGDKRKYFSPMISLQVSDNTVVDIQADYLNQISGRDSRLTSPDGRVSKVMITDPNYNKTDYTIKSISYKLKHDLNKDTQFRQNLRYEVRDDKYQSVFAQGYINDELNLPTSLMRRYARLSEGKSHYLVLDNQFETKVNSAWGEHQLLLGLDYGNNSTESVYTLGRVPNIDFNRPVYGVDIATPSVKWSDNTQKQSSIGLYLQDQIRFQAPWLLTLGLRHDWVKNETIDNMDSSNNTESNDKAFSGRVGLNYLYSKELVPFLSLSTSFEPNEGLNTQGGLLSPTKGRQIEVGLKYQPAASESLFTLSAFDIRQSDVIYAANDNSGRYTQAGKVKSTGLEFEAKSALTSSLILTAAYSYNQVEILSNEQGNQGKSPTLTPKNNASLWLDYTQKSGFLNGLGIAAGMRYSGSSWGDDANTVENDSVTTFDLATYYKYKQWGLNLMVSNLSNQSKSSFEKGEYFWSPERTVKMSASYRW